MTLSGFILIHSLETGAKVVVGHESYHCRFLFFVHCCQKLLIRTLIWVFELCT